MTSAQSAESDKVSARASPHCHKVGNTQDGEGNGTEIKALGPKWREELKRKLEETKDRFSEARKKVKDRKIRDLELVSHFSIAVVVG